MPTLKLITQGIAAMTLTVGAIFNACPRDLVVWPRIPGDVNNVPWKVMAADMGTDDLPIHNFLGSPVEFPSGKGGTKYWEVEFKGLNKADEVVGRFWYQSGSVMWQKPPIGPDDWADPKSVGEVPDGAKISFGFELHNGTMHPRLDIYDEADVIIKGFSDLAKFVGQNLGTLITDIVL